MVPIAQRSRSRASVQPLVDRMSVSPEWQLVYQDGQALLLVRDTPQNNFFFRDLFLPKKEKILDQIIAEGLQGIKVTPATWGYYEVLGKVYMQRKEINKAKKMFAKYLSINPYNEEIKRILDMLENLPVVSPGN